MLASVVPSALPSVQAQGTPTITLDGDAGNSLIPASHLQKLDDKQHIGNSRSMIFHYARCRYVEKMSDAHKVYFGNRDDAIDAGYRPGKVCRP